MLHCIEKLNEVRRDLGGLERAVKQISQELELINKMTDKIPLRFDQNMDEWARDNLILDDPQKTAYRDQSVTSATDAYQNWHAYARSKGLNPQTQARWGRAMGKLFGRKKVMGLVYYRGFQLRPLNGGEA